MESKGESILKPGATRTITLGSREFEPVHKYQEVDEVLRRSRDFVSEGARMGSHQFLEGTIVALDGKEHLLRRRLLSRIMDVRQPWGPRGGLFQGVFDRRLELVRERLARQEMRTFDLVEFARQVYWQTFAVMIGLDGVNNETEVDRLQGMATQFVNATTLDFTLGDRAEIVRQAREALAAAKEAFLPSFHRRMALVRQHSASGTDGYLPNDLITTMIRAAEGEPNADLIIREAITFFTAAGNNPVSQASFGLDDLESWLADHPQDLVLIRDDQFYNAAVQETLRMHRTGKPFLMRQAVHDTKIEASGRPVRAGQWLSLHIGDANRDPDVFGPTADRYDPHRVVKTKGVKPFGLAFGSGPHVCLGRPLLVWEHGAPMELGLMARMLKSLVLSGIRVDPQGERVKAQHTANSYTRFGVFLGDSLTSTA